MNDVKGSLVGHHTVRLAWQLNLALDPLELLTIALALALVAFLVIRRARRSGLK